MRNLSFIFCIAAVLLDNRRAAAQPPFPMPGPPSRTDSGLDGFIGRMMSYDVDHDGKLSRNEITDERLLGLFDRADINREGIVTKAELKALYKRESAFSNDRGPGRSGAERRGPGFRPQVGQVLPETAQRILNLTPEQKTTLAEIQREVDARLDRLLTPTQKTQLNEMLEHDPGGGPMRGPKGFGRPPGPQGPYR